MRSLLSQCAWRAIELAVPPAALAVAGAAWIAGACAGAAVVAVLSAAAMLQEKKA